MRSMIPPSLDLRREREATWRELDQIVTRAELRGLRRLDARDIARLPLLQRLSASSLAVARSLCLSRNQLDYLESLVARAHIVSNPAPLRLRQPIVDFLGFGFPDAVRRYGRHVLVSTAMLLLGAAVAFVLTLQNPEHFYEFVPEAYAQGRDPTASDEDLRGVLYGTAEVDELGAFASMLLSNNAKVGMMCFALGFAFGVPVLYLLFSNGLILGAFGALYHSRGMSAEFWAWVLPHGVTELFAVILCGAAGLAMAQALMFPGRLPRLLSLAQVSRDVGNVVLGSVLMFGVAALIEGFFRQLVHDLTVRYAVIGLSTLLLAIYFSWVGTRRARAAQEPGVRVVHALQTGPRRTA